MAPVFQNAEHVQNEKCGALKMREFLNIWIVGMAPVLAYQMDSCLDG